MNSRAGGKEDVYREMRDALNNQGDAFVAKSLGVIFSTVMIHELLSRNLS